MHQRFRPQTHDQLYYASLCALDKLYKLTRLMTVSFPQEAKMKKKLKMKLEMAKFLQQTLDNMSVVAKGRSSESAKEFVSFFEKVSKTQR